MGLLENPFHILTATVRDNRQKIMELADERSLLLDPDTCMQARATLTHPRQRLAAEMSWLPGISPKQADKIISQLHSMPISLFSAKIPVQIAHTNVLASALTQLPALAAENVAKWIIAIADAFESVDPEELRMMINEDRVVSGFPEVTELSVIEGEIQERRRDYKQAIRAILDKLTSSELVKAVTITVETATEVGEKQGPILIDDLVDAYAVDANEFLCKEEENIKTMLDELKSAVEIGNSDAALNAIIDQLTVVIKNWDFVAQPIQVSTKSRGQGHDESQRIAAIIRNVAIDLWNNHQKLELSQRIADILQEVFAEVVTVAERTAEDANALEKIAENREKGNLLVPIYALCANAMESAQKYPSSADQSAINVINNARQLIVNLSNMTQSRDIISEGNNIISSTLLDCAIKFGNSTKKWSKCIQIINVAVTYASEPTLRIRILENLDIVTNNIRLQPSAIKNIINFLANLLLANLPFLAIVGAIILLNMIFSK
ncbi:MAG: HrpB1 family type III secretion system apparatus protein [Desulfovibrio sp.]|jgi:hypothetical protein|nr:HrpB1 family type III secretion system apparatus protein [Desulfovibrio sp.]